MNSRALALTSATALAARQRIQSFCVRLPLVRLNCASARPIYLKLENLQPVGSFKIRCGASAGRSTPCGPWCRSSSTAR
jgi:threonine dehydratase